MERSIRIGKDFNVRWSIHGVVDGERQPYELAGKELVLQYRTPYGLKEATEWKTEGNTIVWTFRGKEQKALGSYELILTENGGKDGMVTVDTCRAFKLVAHSCEETEGSGSDIVVQTIMLETEVAFAPLTIQTGGGGEGGSYDDTELRGMIAEQGERIDALADEVQDLKESGLGYDDTELRQQVGALADEVTSNGQLIEDLQNMKIDKENDDYYPSMSVGLADNLAGVDVVESEFTFRQSGGGAISDGVARVQSIKGNSVVWNQMAKLKKYNETEILADGTIKFVSTPPGNWPTMTEAMQGKINNAYAFILSSKGGAYDNAANYGQVFAETIYVDQPKIVKLSKDFQTSFTFRAADCAGLILSVCVYDLTKMFGAGNEPTTIDEFYARIPQGVDLNAYNEGEIISMRAEGIKSVGVNAWDEQWENGIYNADTGAKIDTPNVITHIRCKNPIFILPNTKYYFSIPKLAGGSYMGFAIFFDKDKKYISKSPIGPSAYSEVNTPSNAVYMVFYLREEYGNIYNHDICIGIKGDWEGYHAPIESSEDFGFVAKYFPDGMRSAGTAHDEIRYNKATNRWEAVKRVGEVKMKDLSWAFSGGTPSKFSAQIPLVYANANDFFPYLLTARYTSVRTDLKADKSIYRAGSYVGLYDSGYSDLASFIASLTDEDILYYRLAEPIVTEIEEKDFNLDYKVWNCGTEQMVATEPSSPLSAEIVYGFNAPAKIKENANEIAKLKQSSGSTTTYKTINGTSVVGSGNIDTHYPISSSTASALTIQPNTYYKWSGATLNVTLGSTDANLCEFVIELAVTGTPSITFPSSVKWANGIAPTFVSGKSYIVSIVNNLGVYAAF